jgi:hypothetical protein
VKRATVLSYPRWYRKGPAWGETREAFMTGVAPFAAYAGEGVHSLGVMADGTCVLGHCGHTMTFRLRGIVAAKADGTFLDAITINLAGAACRVPRDKRRGGDAASSALGTRDAGREDNDSLTGGCHPQASA